MRKFLILHLLLLCSFAAHAQETETGSDNEQEASTYNSWLGVKAGVNLSDIYGSDKDLVGNTDNITSFHAGMFAQIGWSEYFALRPELVYSRKGYERADSVFRFDYLEVPILAVINITGHISAHVGPQISVMVSAKEEGKEVALKNYNTFDYGAAAGLEGRLNRFILGARYNLSFEELIKKDDAGHTNLAVHPKVIQVYLGVAF